MTFSKEEIFNPTIMLALALMAVIVMMILPMPSIVLDIGLAASFGLAILIFTTTLFIERPLDFSVFPTVLLASLMLRLSLNVSSTKLIIGQGHTGTRAAGSVIEGFASFVMGGSVFLGLVVFGVLLIVNFMVINKGATRMAEVGARFALDAMPGKQLAIDSDMSAGAIGHAEASERRAREQAETTFFGSLDGASKFVKGDAIAGLLITAMNLVMGMIMGTVVHGMPFAQAMETYAILTVGDGLVSQIPAVIISIASALLLARGGAIGATDMALFSQLGRYPAALATVAVLMAFFGLVPGLPIVPFFLGAAALGGAAYWARKNAQNTPAEEDVVEEGEPLHTSLGDVLDLDDIHVEFSSDLVPMVLDSGTGLNARIANMRNHIATEYGLLMPDIRLTDSAKLPPGQYLIRVHGVEQARDILRPNQVLVLLGDQPELAPEGEDVAEPVYGAPARWVSADAVEDAALNGLTTVSTTEVLATHLLEVIKQNFPRLLTLKVLRRILDEMVNLSDPKRSEANRKMLEALIPDKVPNDLLLAVLRSLLDEGVSIRNMTMILEATAEARQAGANLPQTVEHVRQKLGFQLVSGLKRADGTIPLVQLDPAWEPLFARHQLQSDALGDEVALPPDDFNRLGEAMAQVLSDLAQAGTSAGVVTSAHRRRFIRSVAVARGLRYQVLSFEEIGMDARPALVGTVAA